MSKKERPDFDKKAYLNEHVLYEIEKAFNKPLTEIYTKKEILQDGKVKLQIDGTENDIWISKYIHIRNLFAFFNKKGNHHHLDVLSTDYDFPLKKFKYDKLKLDRHKVHLSIDRINKPDDGIWDIEVFNEVGKVTLGFLSHLRNQNWIEEEKINRWDILEMNIKTNFPETTRN